MFKMMPGSVQISVYQNTNQWHSYHEAFLCFHELEKVENDWTLPTDKVHVSTQTIQQKQKQIKLHQRQRNKSTIDLTMGIKMLQVSVLPWPLYRMKAGKEMAVNQ